MKAKYCHYYSDVNLKILVTQPFIPCLPHVLPLRLCSPSAIKLFLNCQSWDVPHLLIEYAPTLLPP
jgi:hypothetical protein